MVMNNHIAVLILYKLHGVFVIIDLFIKFSYPSIDLIIVLVVTAIITVIIFYYGWQDMQGQQNL